MFQKSRRTAYGLHFRFRYHLRNDYAKYTNNAEALEKFREMELERPVKEKTNNE
uniref:Uncharacterized protein n=1 Tax=Bracon brevicornis TaxID=1563983 RepID=A0A6V7LWY6_9HYME